MLRPSRLALVLVLLAAAIGCGSEPQPVGSLVVTPDAFDLPHSGWQRLELAWRMTAPIAGLEGDLRVLLHLEDGAGELARTFDHPFPDEWTPGGETTYEVPIYQSALGAALGSGEYLLRAGLYDLAGNRWAVTADPVARVHVADPGEDFPELSFSADWLPTEPGGDLQILARRWLDADGAIRIRGIGAEGALWLRLGIPSASDRQRMVLAEGASQAVATITAGCSGFEAEVSGSGSHSLEIPLAPGADGPGECRILFSTNFELLSTENDEKRTIALESVAWGG